MIRSMTGYGDAQGTADANAYHVEIRTVNNRYLKCSIRLPEDFAFMEADIEKLLRARLARGSVSFRLYYRALNEDAAFNLNSPALRSYIQQLREVAGDDSGLTIDLATLASLPGVCQPQELTDDECERRWEVAEKLTKEALDRLVAMRKVEGDALAEDLRKHCTLISEQLTHVKARAPFVVAEYQIRLRDRVNELLAKQNLKLTEEDLAREVAIYAERSDINEEIARLEGHIQQFDSSIGGGEPSGRKLEFIAQEMLREANTMGAKSGDPELTRRIIDIKGAVDRIKEQVQNVE